MRRVHRLLGEQEQKNNITGIRNLNTFKGIKKLLQIVLFLLCKISGLDYIYLELWYYRFLFYISTHGLI